MLYVKADKMLWQTPCLGLCEHIVLKTWKLVLINILCPLYILFLSCLPFVAVCVYFILYACVGWGVGGSIIAWYFVHVN